MKKLALLRAAIAAAMPFASFADAVTDTNDVTAVVVGDRKSVV